MDRRQIVSAAWPLASLPEAFRMVAARYGIAAAAQSAPAAPPPSDEQLSPWLESQARRTGLQAEQTFASLDELETLLRRGAPLIVRLTGFDEPSFLVVVASDRRRLDALAPDGSTCTLRTRSVVALIRSPFEARTAAPVDALVDRMNLRGRWREAARHAMVRDRLAAIRFRSCWMLRLPAGGAIWNDAGAARLGVQVATLAGAYVAQYGCFVASWWLLGQAMMDEAGISGWLLGWLLLLVSVIPLRVLVAWEQGALAIKVGTWLRRRLLRGAFQVDRQHLKRRGVGQLFSAAVEAAALDTTALTGGLSATFALVEILGAASVLWLGASRILPLALLAWTLVAGGIGWLYLVNRRAWTAQRFAMAHDLLESMMGHRTRIAQQHADAQHVHEDHALDRALELGLRMDRRGLWLTAIIPRGWLVVALAALVPGIADGAAGASAVAVSLGGTVLAYRALYRLTAGVVHIAGAVLAAESIRPLLAAGRQPSAVSPVTDRTGWIPASQRQHAVIHARDLVFRYRQHGEPVLAGASLTIEPGARYLLEGDSGSGKTTFASLLAGLDRPESGLILSNGLDRQALGDAGWRSRVVMAPQPHDNYLMGASLAFNLLMGRRWPPEEEDLAEAEVICRELGLGDLLDRLPAGLDQVVGETGWQLSQGECARVFLARALLQRPALLVLDEPFATLDPENIDRALRTIAARSVSVLAIAHM